MNEKDITSRIDQLVEVLDEIDTDLRERQDMANGEGAVMSDTWGFARSRDVDHAIDRCAANVASIRRRLYNFYPLRSKPVEKADEKTP